jgi:hypothetical protein
MGFDMDMIPFPFNLTNTNIDFSSFLWVEWGIYEDSNGMDLRAIWGEGGIHGSGRWWDGGEIDN